MSRDSIKGTCKFDHVPRHHYGNEYGKDRPVFPPIDCAEQKTTDRIRDLKIQMNVHEFVCRNKYQITLWKIVLFHT